MANTIILKKSSTGGSEPDDNDIVAGELIINTADGKLFYGDDSGNAQTLNTSDGTIVAAANAENEDQYIAFIDNANGTAQSILYDTPLTYNPSSNTLKADNIVGLTAILPDAAGGADLGSTSFEWGDIYIHDDKKIMFGDSQDASIEYDENGTDTLLFSGNAVQFDGTNSPQITRGSDTAGNIPQLKIQRAKGSFASPTLVDGDESLGGVAWYGYDGNDYELAAKLEVITNNQRATPASNVMPGGFVWHQRFGSNNGTSESMWLDQYARLQLGSYNENLNGDVLIQCNLDGGLISCGDSAGNGATTGGFVFKGRSDTGLLYTGSSVLWLQNTGHVNFAIDSNNNTTTSKFTWLKNNNNEDTATTTDLMTLAEDGHLLPGADDTQHLGSASKQWNNLYIGGDIIASDAVFTVQTQIFEIGDGTDANINMRFNSNSASGHLWWMEDEDYFKFSDHVTLDSTSRLNFGDTGTYIYQSADGVLDLVSDSEIELNATTIDMNGALDLSGNLTLGGNIVCSGDFTVDSEADLNLDANGSNWVFKDGGAGKIFEFTNANTGETSLITNYTDKDFFIKLNDGGSTITALTLDASEAGAATFNSTITTTGLILDSNTITGVDDSDEFTDDDAHIMTSAAINDRFSTTDTTYTAGAGISIVGGGNAITVSGDSITEAMLDVSNAPTNGYALTAQSAQGGGLTWADVTGGGTPSVITVADESSDATCFPAFFTAATGDLEPKTGSNLIFNSSTGVLEATGLRGTVGTATQGTIDHDSLANFVANEHINWTSTSSNFSTSGTLASGAITAAGHTIPSAANTYALGSASAEWSDLYLGDGSYIYFGNDQDVSIKHIADTGLLLSGTDQIQFNDSSQTITAPDGATLDINATTEIELNTTTVDVNAALDVSGAVTFGTIAAASSDTDMFLVSDSGVIKRRTGAQVASDIGAVTSDSDTTYSISCVDGDNSDEEKIRLTAGGSGSGTDDIVLEAGTGLSIARSSDKITFTNTVSDTNTQYTAGTGLDLSSTEFSVDVSDFMTNGANNYLVTATGADGMNAEVNLRSTGSNIYLKNESSAGADILNYGQLWVKDNGSGEANTELYFTNDAGSDIQITNDDGLAGGGGGGSGLATDMSNCTVPTAINTTLVSDTNATDDLGTSGIGWKDLYLTGSVFVDGVEGVTNNIDVLTSASLIPVMPGVYSLATTQVQLQFNGGVLTRTV